jgi:hypothetical protein
MSKFFTLIMAIVLFAIGVLLSETGVVHITNKYAYSIEEPLLIDGGKQNAYSILPVGTVLYLDKSWPEGHSTYHVYFHFKGDFKATAADSKMITPLWLRTVDADEVTKLMSEYPVSRDDLLAILKVRKMTRDDLAQIVRDWKD